MDKKYEILPRSGYDKVRRIRALRSFDDVKAGDLGGMIQQESNLSHHGNCWVYKGALVFDRAAVMHDAKLRGNSCASDYAIVRDMAELNGGASVTGRVYVEGNARVKGYARMRDHAVATGHAEVGGGAVIEDYAKVLGDARVEGQAVLSGRVRVYGDAVVGDEARLQYGAFNGNSTKDFKAVLFSTFNILPVGSDYILYKKVGRVSEGVYHSLHDSRFLYKDGEISEAPSVDLDPRHSCAAGLHLSTPTYWSAGNTLIACQFRLEDVLAVQEGKVRVRRVLCLGKVTF